LLREGLDLPEVALVAIMDADIECFLRDKRSLIQTIGRAARNIQSRVILYADTISSSMRSAMDETARRRAMQIAYNEEHKITTQTAKRTVTKSISPLANMRQKSAQKLEKKLDKKHARVCMLELERLMQEAAERLDFETAIKLREEWK